MATVKTSVLAGDDAGNGVDEDFVLDLLWGASPMLSVDGHTLTYTRADGDLVFESTTGFTAPWNGTLTAIRSASITVTGLQVDGSKILAALRDADADAINALLWGRADTMTGSAGNDELRGFAGDDLLRGAGGNDSLFGGGGLDRLYGDAGNDAVSGGLGRDTLFGAAGNDTLMGGAGDDRLVGGAGIDSLLGGSGADEFVFVSAGDIAVVGTGTGPDIITDFRMDEGDVINLAGIDADTTTDGDQAFTYIGADAFTADAPGTVRVVAGSFPNTYLVQLNTDGDVQFEHLFVVATPGIVGEAMFVL